MWKPSKFKAGDHVVVRSKEEILATLDANGCLDGMPFMPEMLEFCGRKMRIAAAAHKTCDPAHKTGGRRVNEAVHLDGARCDGAAHGGCQAECNIFWKDAWLKSATAASASLSAGESGKTASTLPTMKGDCYTCQATELVHASEFLPWWNLRQYMLDVTSRNHSFKQVAKVLLLSWSRQLLRLPFGFRLWRKVNDGIHRAVMRRPAPYYAGAIKPGQKTPSTVLDLKPGEFVRVKPLQEIANTLDANSKNRGMWFDVEQAYFCESDFKVHRRVSRIIDERTGKMMELKNPCITLEGVLCSGYHSADRLLCPRAITPYWREAWLDRKE